MKPRRHPVSAPASPLLDVAREQLNVLGGLLDEVSRAYTDRLRRELGDLQRILAEARTKSRLDKPRLQDLKEITRRMARFEIRPEKGRRKDLKKIDSLIGEVQSLLEKW